MSFLRSLRNSIDPKRNRLLLFFSIISIFLALSTFFRFLQFNQTSYLGKIIIFIPLYLFFFFSLVEFSPSFVNHFLKNTINTILTVGTILTVTVVLYLLPYQFAPFRTLHTLIISVPKTSSPVTFQKITDIAGNLIESTDSNSFATAESIIIQPGESISLKQAMTGGVTIFVTANHFPANVTVNWDGVVSQYKITQAKTETKITTKASSWGMPTLPHAILAVINLFGDWVSCVFLLILIFRLGITSSRQNGFNSGEPQIINPLFLLMQIILIISAGVLINIPDSPKYLLYLVIGISFFLWILLFVLGNSKKDIPWAYIFSRFFSTKNRPVSFFIVLSILAILGNAIFLPIYGNPINVYVRRNGTTLTDLLSDYSNDIAFVLSIDFYKQLDRANIIISEGMVERVALIPSYFSELNQLKSIKVQEYTDYLSKDQVEAVMNDDRLITFENARRKIGYYHLLETSNNDSHTYVFFQFEDDVFLLPENFLNVSLP
jgi:hypothetical protein